jgi:hypothetical protein
MSVGCSPGGTINITCQACGDEVRVARGSLLDERQLRFCPWCRHDL